MSYTMTTAQFDKWCKARGITGKPGLRTLPSESDKDRCARLEKAYDDLLSQARDLAEAIEDGQTDEYARKLAAEFIDRYK